MSTESSNTTPQPVASPTLQQSFVTESATTPTATTSRPKRTSVACRRCRRLRVKCVQEQNRLPCQQCRTAGGSAASECATPKRGDDRDRRYRTQQDAQLPQKEQQHQQHHQQHHQQQQVRKEPPAEPDEALALGDAALAIWSPPSFSPHTARRIEIYSTSDLWSLLPPLEELIRGANVFVTNCLQVGFIPKALFIERLSKDAESVNVFLLISMLTISARFTPELCTRFEGGRQASDFFMEMANVLVADEMFKMDLETAQAFFLLGMAEWGKGERSRSAIHMGIAVRIVGVLRLHREESYALPSGASPDDIVNSEHARRTFWAVKSHDNLYTQQHLPTSFANSDITTLLPCSENDFAFGRVPMQRAALAGTIPALKDPHLATLPTRSMFATLIQIHDLWGMIARTACRDELLNDRSDSRPWEDSCRYKSIAKLLSEWEANIPREHEWSAWNLRGYQAEHVDLAYLSIITITRMNNIVLRRSYLADIVSHIVDSETGDALAPPGFWETMSYELFSNVLTLYEAIETYFSMRRADDGFPTMLAFCAYTCGSIISYLCRWPRLCPQLCASAEKVLHGTLDALSTFADKWPLANEWVGLLRGVAHQGQQQRIRPVAEVSSREELLNTIATVPHSPVSRTSPRSTVPNQSHGQGVHTQPVHALDLLSDAATYHIYDQQSSSIQQLPLVPETSNSGLNMFFDAELADYMQGYVHCNFADWQV